MPNNNLANATKPMDTSSMSIVSFPAAPPAPPNTSADPEFSPLALAPIPNVMGTDTDASRQFYRNAVSQLRMPPLPAAAKIAQGAQAASQVILGGGGSSGADFQTNNVDNPVQTKLNLTGSGVSYGPGPGQVQIASGSGDGEIHGDPLWKLDPGDVFLRDDFIQMGAAITSGIFTSELTWNCTGASTGGQLDSYTGVAPYLGQILIGNGSSAYTGSTATTTIIYPLATPGYGQNAMATMALVESPSWQFDFEFNIGRPYITFNQASNTPTAFSWTQVCLYVGLANYPAGPAPITSSNSCRPPCFVGVRYDTDPGQTYALSAVANGTGAYTFTATQATAANNAFVGMEFVVTGFTNPASNGTFVCTASSSTVLTLNNSSSVAGGSGSAAEVGTADTHFVFECVTSGISTSAQRNSAQGNTFNTGMSVTEGNHYRLSIQCVSAGTVKMTLSDGTTSATATLAVPQFSITSASNGGYLSQGLGIFKMASVDHPFCPGSIITASGWTSGLASMNGTWTTLGGAGGQICFYLAGSSGPTTQNATIAGYPALTPWFGFGNDSQSSPTSQSKAVFWDFFSFLWNPGVGGNTATIPNPLKGRYF